MNLKNSGAAGKPSPDEDTTHDVAVEHWLDVAENQHNGRTA